MKHSDVACLKDLKIEFKYKNFVLNCQLWWALFLKLKIRLLLTHILMDILPPALFLLSLWLFFQSCVFLVCLPKNPLFTNALTFSYLITSDFLGSPTNHWSSCSIYIWVMIVDSVTKPPRCSISGNYVLVEKRSLQWHKGCWCNPTQMHPIAGRYG